MDKAEVYSIINENMQVATQGVCRARTALTQALELMTSKHILSIVGVRRCGKSTLMKELIRVALNETEQENILYLPNFHSSIHLIQAGYSKTMFSWF